MLFEYIARTKEGKKIVSRREVSSREELVRFLQNKGYYVISVYPAQRETRSFFTSKLVRRFTHSRIKSSDLILFARQMATMLGAGVSLVKSLEIISRQISSKKFFDVIEDVKSEIEKGSSFSEVLKRYSGIFSSLWVSLIETGEASGNLSIVLERLAAYLEDREEFKRKIITALIYPSILFIVAIGAILIFIFKIIPTFSKIFKEFDITLPLPTQILIKVSNFIMHFWYILFIIIPLGVFFLYKYLRTGGRNFFDRLMLRLPILGNLIREISIEHFSAEMKTLLEAGVPIVYTLEMSEKSANNIVLRSILEKVKEAVKAGKTLSEPLESSGYFPPMVVQLIRIGEEVGDLPGMFRRINEYYSLLIETKISRMLALFEPFMIVFMGVIIGGMVISMYLPIFKLATLGR